VLKSIVPAVVAGLFTLGANSLEAQSCLGTASFTAGPARLGVAGAFPEGAKEFGGQLAYGQVNGGFGAVSVARATANDADVSSMTYGVTGGYQLNLGQRGGAQLCPVGGLSYSTTDEVEFLGSSIDASARTFQAGLAVGAPLNAGATAQLVPFGSLSLANTSATVTVDGEDSSNDETYGVMQLGAGLVLGRAITVQPSVSIPLGLEDADAVFSVAMGFNFGARGAR
jgi:hypothetical protein